MTVGRETAMAFVESYGRAWEAWDITGFVELFSDDVVYVVHPTDETVVGRGALTVYVHKEHVEQGDVRVALDGILVGCCLRSPPASIPSRSRGNRARPIA